VPTRLLSWADWRQAHPGGLVLSTETGHRRDYGVNPYAGYEDAEQPFLFVGEPDPRLPATGHVLGVAGPKTIAFPYSELDRLSSGGLTAVHRTLGGERVVVFWKAGTVSALDAAEIPRSAHVGAAAAYIPRIGTRRLTFVVADEAFVDEQTGTRWTIAGVAVEGPL
jgi:hypothetical protein